jgi:hypothetical protein
MRHLLCVILLAGACGGGQASGPSKGGSDRKIADLENQLEDAQASLTKEKTARATAEAQLAETKAKLAAAEAKAAAAAPAATPGAPATPPVAAVPPVPDPAAPPPPPKPVSARITEKKSTGTGVRVTIGAGTNRGVAVGWTGNIFQGKSSKLLTKFKIIAVREGECEGQVPANMTLDTIGTNDRVELLAPGAVGSAQ